MANLLSHLPLARAAVARSATFGAASRLLSESGLPAIAVLDRTSVVGLFTADDLLRGLFPGYLADLQHTAFAPDDLAAVVAHAHELAVEPVGRRCGPPVTAESSTSLLHAAELFLHNEPGAIAVVEDGRFVGVLTQTVLCDAVFGLVRGRW